mmetsp:Transcript_10762/g.33026  ORF Transcript_10762/g.33026 Transcript_10762/m.33026 type:complete len:462 (+) Transcript_10762:104-1489(+)
MSSTENAMTSRATTTKLFGVSLNKLMARPGEKTIPTFVKNVMRHLNREESLKTQGLFRVSASVAELEAHQKRLDNGEDIVYSELSSHMVAALLKAWLIELPEPLLTFKLYNNFIEAAGSPEKERVERLKDAVRRLPPLNKAVADSLFLFMCRVRQYQELNQMTAHNVAIVFAQILLRPETDSMLLLTNATKTTNAILWMIENYYEVFARTRPDALLMQVSADSGDADDAVDVADQEEPKHSIPVGMILSSRLRNITESESKKGILLLQDRVVGTINELIRNLDELQQELEVANDWEVINIAKRVRTCHSIAFSMSIESSTAGSENTETSGVEREESVRDYVVPGPAPEEVNLRPSDSEHDVSTDREADSLPNEEHTIGSSTEAAPTTTTTTTIATLPPWTLRHRLRTTVVLRLFRFAVVRILALLVRVSPSPGEHRGGVATLLAAGACGAHVRQHSARIRC